MFVPAKRAYMTPEEAKSLRKMDTWHVDSGLGGAFEVVYVGLDDAGKHHFKCTSKDWPYEYHYSRDELPEKLFNLVPA